MRTVRGQDVAMSLGMDGGRCAACFPRRLEWHVVDVNEETLTDKNAGWKKCRVCIITRPSWSIADPFCLQTGHS